MKINQIFRLLVEIINNRLWKIPELIIKKEFRIMDKKQIPIKIYNG